MTYSLEVSLLCGFFLLVIVICGFMYRNKNRLKNDIEAKTEMFKKAFDISDDAVLLLDKKMKTVYANPAALKLLSLNSEYQGKPLSPMPSVKIKKEWIPFDQFLKHLPAKSEEKMHRFPQSSLHSGEDQHYSIPVNLYIDCAETQHESTCCTIVLIHDLRHEYERHKVAYRHKLTDLPNHLQAKEDLHKIFSKIHLHNKKLALMLIELDNFSQIRSMIGYDQSESVLIGFAQYLDNLSRSSSFYVYHTYSNHFLICIPVVDTADEVVYLGRQIQQRLSSLYKVNNVRFHLTATIGISIYPDSGSTLVLLDRAYKALAKAQKNGLGQIAIYEQNEYEKKYDEIEIYNALSEAIDKKEFEVYYQPIIRSKGKEVVGAEALVRWTHKQYGMIPPDVFIPLLEKSGFIIELGKFVLSEVLKQQKRWEMFKFKPIEVSINMSILEIESEGFVENVSRQLTEHQVSPELLRFEITEGLAMKNEVEADQQIQALKKLGVSIALDDFGTGYTSFGYLKKFPAEVLKIDKSLVEYITDNEEEQRIVKAMIDLGHSLGMKIVVEGIETSEMAEMITEFGADYLQGYYFSKPIPAYEFQEMIRL